MDARRFVQERRSSREGGGGGQRRAEGVRQSGERGDRHAPGGQVVLAAGILIDIGGFLFIRDRINMIKFIS